MMWERYSYMTTPRGLVASFFFSWVTRHIPVFFFLYLFYLHFFFKSYHDSKSQRFVRVRRIGRMRCRWLSDIPRPFSWQCHNGCHISPPDSITPASPHISSLARAVRVHLRVVAFRGDGRIVVEEETDTQIMNRTSNMLANWSMYRVTISRYEINNTFVPMVPGMVTYTYDAALIVRNKHNIVLDSSLLSTAVLTGRVLNILRGAR